jgi:hypothetical protein
MLNVITRVLLLNVRSRRVSDAQLKHYISQLLAELADLADGRTNDAELGALAFKLRLLAGLQNVMSCKYRQNARPYISYSARTSSDFEHLLKSLAIHRLPEQIWP